MGYLLYARRFLRSCGPHIESEVGGDAPVFHLMEQAQRQSPLSQVPQIKGDTEL